MLTFNWSSPKNQVNFGGGLASSAMHSTATSAWSAILTLYSCGALMSAILIWTVVGGTMNQKIFNVVIISKQELILKSISNIVKAWMCCILPATVTSTLAEDAMALLLASTADTWHCHFPLSLSWALLMAIAQVDVP